MAGRTGSVAAVLDPSTRAGTTGLRRPHSFHPVFDLPLLDGICCRPDYPTVIGRASPHIKEEVRARARSLLPRTFERRHGQVPTKPAELYTCCRAVYWWRPARLGDSLEVTTTTCNRCARALG